MASRTDSSFFERNVVRVELDHRKSPFGIANIEITSIGDQHVANPKAYSNVTAPVVRPGYAWVPGYWDWRGNRHVWVNGTWVRARPGYHYSQPTWVHEGDHWRLTRGGWNRGDRDRDGVPNRYDRQPDNPYRR